MKKFLIPILAAGIVAILIYTVQGTGSLEEVQNKNYLEEIRQERRDKDNFMKYDDQSPLPDGQKKDFSGLKYFEPDKSWRIEADVQENKEKDLLVLSTSDNKQKPFKKWGYAVFTRNGQEIRLLLLQPAYGVSPDELFLPFLDATSANETYGAGRYLDLEMPKRKKVILDFNKAYNPYCAYAEGYSCPFPPKENVISIAVEAGEKTFENYH